MYVEAGETRLLVDAGLLQIFGILAIVVACELDFALQARQFQLGSVELFQFIANGGDFRFQRLRAGGQRHELRLALLQSQFGGLVRLIDALLRLDVYLFFPHDSPGFANLRLYLQELRCVFL